MLDTATLTKILTNPYHVGSDLIYKQNFWECSITKKKFYQNKYGTIDFINDESTLLNNDKNNKPVQNINSFIFKLNEYYNQKLEQKISNSIFSVGGIGYFFIQKKLLNWLKNFNGIVMDVGCGDQKWKKYLSPDSKYLSLDYLPACLSCPWRISYPQLNADALNLPLKNNSVDAIINIAVIEHVKDPAKMIEEFSRVLKPNGFLILVGPGDICLTHGEPYNYFNLTHLGYKLLLDENKFKIIDEYFPIKSFLSIFNLLYIKLVRNNFYNKNSFLKILQLFVFFISIILSPLINILGIILDVIIPFDKRGYNTYMVLAQKLE